MEDPAERIHAKVLRAYCEEVFLAPLNPTRARILSLRGFLRHEPLTLSYFQSARLRTWVAREVTGVVIFEYLDALADEISGAPNVLFGEGSVLSGTLYDGACDDPAGDHIALSCR